MTVTNDFVRKFDLEKTIGLSVLHAQKPSATLSDISLAMSPVIIGKNYVVRPRTEKTSDAYISLGKEKSDEIHLSSKALLLESYLPERQFMVALSYFSLPDIYSFNPDIDSLPHDPRVESVLISFVQSPANVDLNKYNSFQESIGCNPHEFLMAHFITRLRGVLNVFPDMNVAFADKYSEHPASKRLKDRFLNKQLELNPSKERVSQLLGLENAWIKYRS